MSSRSTAFKSLIVWAMVAPWAVLRALMRLLESSATLATAVGSDEVCTYSSCAVSDLFWRSIFVMRPLSSVATALCLALR